MGEAQRGATGLNATFHGISDGNVATISTTPWNKAFTALDESKAARRGQPHKAREVTSDSPNLKMRCYSQRRTWYHKSSIA